MSANTPEPESTKPAETPQPEPDTPDTETTPAEGDNLGDDRLAEMARPFLDQPEAGDIEVHHGPAPDDEPVDETADEAPSAHEPDDMPHMGLGHSIFAELARANSGLYGDWPDLPATPGGIARGFDEVLADNADGFFADKTSLAAWMRTARANTYGTESAAA